MLFVCALTYNPQGFGRAPIDFVTESDVGRLRKETSLYLGVYNQYRMQLLQKAGVAKMLCLKLDMLKI